MTYYFKNRFKDKVVVITGSARGIGKATALRAAKEGAKIVIVDKLYEEGHATLNEILDMDGEAIFVHVDLSIEANAKEMINQTINAFHRLDIAINNAGIMGDPSPIHLMTKEQMDDTMNNNFYSLFYCCKYELQQFIKQELGGIIVNVGSVGGLTGLVGTPAYVASKYAVNGLTKNIALDYAKYGIRINSINPAATSTHMNEEAIAFVKKKQASKKDYDEILKESHFKTKSILKEVTGLDATPEQQAAAILFLASQDASIMTGATVATDGGWTAF